MAPPKEKPPLTKQVGFKVDEEMFAALVNSAWSAKRKRNELARLIFEWGFAYFQGVGSFEELMKILPPAAKKGQKVG